MAQDPLSRGDSPELLSTLVRILCDVELAEIDMPHIVVTRLGGAIVACSGPHPDGLSALAAAERERRRFVRSGGRGDRTFGVAALYTPFSVEDPLAPVASQDA